MRIEQAVDDEVVRLGRGAQVRARVVHDAAHARIVVGPLRMVEPAQAQDHGIDLDRVHVLRARAQRRRHVVAGARAQDGHLAGRAVHAVGQLVVEADAMPFLRAGLGLRGEVVDLLVVMAGGADDGEAALSGPMLDDLVGRVDPLPLERDRPGQHDGGHQGRARAGQDHPPVEGLESEEEREEQREPHERRRPQRADHEQQDDAGQAAREVQGVRAQLLAPGHEPPAELSHGQEGERAQDEEHGQERVGGHELGRALRGREADVALLGERRGQEALHPPGVAVGLDGRAG